MKSPYDDDDDFDSDFDPINIAKFLAAAHQAILSRGETYEWTCPICGGNASGGKSSCNGHIHATCCDCGFAIHQ